MKKIIGLVLGLAVGITGCSKQEATPPAENNAKTEAVRTIKVASTGSDTDVWNYIATLPETKAAGIKLEVNNLTDYVILNTSVASGEMDVNAFESFNYLAAYNASNPDAQVYPLATTYLEPMGIYANSIKTVEAFPQGATIAIPNDTANEARALSLLQSAGLIKLKDGFDRAKGTVNDVVENPKALKLKPVQMTTAVRVKNDVDAIVLGNTLALEGGLNVLKDAVFREPVDQSTQLYVNLLGVSKAHKDDPTFAKLGELYHLAEVQKFVTDKFAGTKVEVNKPVAEFSNVK